MMCLSVPVYARVVALLSTISKPHPVCLSFLPRRASFESCFAPSHGSPNHSERCWSCASNFMSEAAVEVTLNAIVHAQTYACMHSVLVN